MDVKTKTKVNARISTSVGVIAILTAFLMATISIVQATQF